MRNLKRALSLLLSSTMVLGMLVMGSSAAGYQDVDASNKNQEAIEVLQAVGIMSGIDDAGNFGPDQAVTRNQMAVIMAHLLNLDYDYYRGVNTFTDRRYRQQPLRRREQDHRCSGQPDDHEGSGLLPEPGGLRL